MDDLPDIHATLVSILRATAPGLSESDLGGHVSRILVDDVLASADPTVGRRGTGPALKSLDGIHKKALALFRAIGEMKDDEKFALRRMQAPTREDMLRTVADLNRHIVAAYEKIKKEPVIPTRGKPRKLDADRVSQNAAYVFQQVTGKRLTWNNRGAMSPFGNFLRAVFKAFDIDASVEHYAKLVSAGRKPKNKN